MTCIYPHDGRVFSITFCDTGALKCRTVSGALNDTLHIGLYLGLLISNYFPAHLSLVYCLADYFGSERLQWQPLKSEDHKMELITFQTREVLL